MSRKMIAAWAAAVLVCIVGIAVFLLMCGIEASAPAAEIYLDGKLYKTISLYENTEFTVHSEYGSNKIRVANGAIAVIEADCPDKVCISSGAVSSGIVPIICLPHRLEIRIISTEADDIDVQIN